MVRSPTVRFASSHGRSHVLAKHIFVTGGVASSLGKGATSSSLGRLLKSRGLRVTMLIVSLAGPTTNFLLMAVSALAAKTLFDPTRVPFGFGYDDLPLGVKILFSFAVVNLFLGLFNLLPIPPLDGSAIVGRVLPEQWLPTWYRFQPYGFLVLFILVFSTGFVSKILEPFYDQLVRFVFG